jgi:hypothetical protein
MSFETSVLRTKWWFFATIALCAEFTKQWVFRSAGVDASRGDLLSARNLLHLLVFIALWFIYTDVVAFLIRSIGPALVRRFSSTARQ